MLVGWRSTSYVELSEGYPSHDIHMLLYKFQFTKEILPFILTLTATIIYSETPFIMIGIDVYSYYIKIISGKIGDIEIDSKSDVSLDTISANISVNDNDSSAGRKSEDSIDSSVSSLDMSKDLDVLVNQIREMGQEPL